MVKYWTKVDNYQFEFSVDETVVGKMELIINSSKSVANCSLNDVPFTIQKQGFWKSSLEILDANGLVIANTYFEKWYAHYSTLTYNGENYKLILRNNPMAEYAILKNDEIILAYSLCLDKQGIKIETNPNNKDFFFDFLVWYAFMHIAVEQLANNITVTNFAT